MATLAVTVLAAVAYRRNKMTAFVKSLLLTTLLLALLAAESRAKERQAFEHEVKPILKKYCYGCHGETTQEADLRLDTLSDNFENHKVAETWVDALEQLKLGEMPPEEEQQPSAAELSTLTEWLTKKTTEAERNFSQHGNKNTMRRLTDYEFRNTMADLLGVDIGDTTLPAEIASEDGFVNDSAHLPTTPTHLKVFWEEIQAALDKVVVDASKRPAVLKDTRTISDNYLHYTDKNNLFYLSQKNTPAHGPFRITVVAKRIDPQKPALFFTFLGTPSNPRCLPMGESIPAATGEQLTWSPKETPKSYADQVWTLAEPLIPGEETRVHFQYTTGRHRLNIKDVRLEVGELKLIDKHFGFTGGKHHKNVWYFRIPKGAPTTGWKLTATVAGDLGNDSNGIITVSGPNDKFAGQEFTTHTFDGFLEDYPVDGLRPKGHTALAWESKVGGKRGRPANIIFKSITLETPYYAVWPPENHPFHLPSKAEQENEELYAKNILERFMSRAYRRKVTAEDSRWLLARYQKNRARYSSFDACIKELLGTILLSPEFLYRIETRSPGNARKQKLDDYELATRMSYFLWGSMPDDTLFKLASENKLSDPSTLSAQIDRMLADKRIRVFSHQFCKQWLGLGQHHGVAISRNYYPAFQNTLKKDMEEETQLFFDEVFFNDLSCLTFLDSDFTFLNEKLAEHYSISGVTGSEMRKVKLSPGNRRGGLLTQASFLMAGSTGEDSHPIRRGVWILSRLLADPPPDPPADVELDKDIKDFDKLTVQKQLEAHRQKTACMRCHKNIDPWGIALEEYGATGQLREQILRKVGNKKLFHPVVSQDTLPGGTVLNGIEGLKAHLLDHKKDAFAQALVRKVVIYALGRPVDFSEQASIDRLAEQFSKDGYLLESLLKKIIMDDIFTTK